METVGTTVKRFDSDPKKMCDGQSAKIVISLFFKVAIFFFGENRRFGTLAVAHFFLILFYYM